MEPSADTPVCVEGDAGIRVRSWTARKPPRSPSEVTRLSPSSLPSTPAWPSSTLASA